VVKSSLHGLTRTLSKELGPDGILVNTVMPGLTRTARFDVLAASVGIQVEGKSPIRRVLTPDEVGASIVFLQFQRKYSDYRRNSPSRRPDVGDPILK
jgi:3-oxoacyl-[acyl-carrier protein] reductase